ncbi:glucose-1-phosphate cytidylyltransferase [Bosea sp. PAMC 26642]|uniref:glucose-1-phosphate cytidylyltransferase n=1 Tax=Bosea sp. (strain PAMC 26642) TaxID=1792307 RepID=UPI00076FEB50|nr:glucose-1-phosphate cytidylyltransferase [Bosea sp. PAMC 26642]AMJ62541.1 glucose-1-phosphate cytidylyltransferase [Bosea sp. PAMC 26642]
MKAVILAGGLGTRLAEETSVRPKPMVEVGGRPILWHILKMYSHHGINDFIICLGYKGDYIRDYFLRYQMALSDFTIDLATGNTTVIKSKAEPWRVTLIDTGPTTMVGGRIKRILPFVGDDQAFCLTYGDGVGNVDLKAVIETHEKGGRLATVTAVQPPGRFGAMRIEGNKVAAFREKPDGDGNWVNGGFFVLNPKVGSYIEGDTTVWEQEPLEKLADDGQLSVYHHPGYWQPMDTLSDKNKLEALWASGKAPWKMWDN